MKSVAFHNLGCKVNSYEMEVMMQYLQNNGYKIVDFEQKADIYIVNTCTVTNIADRKSRQMLHKAKKQNPEAIVVAVGCFVETAKEKIEADESIDLAIGNNRKKDLVPIIEEFLRTREASAKQTKESTFADKTLQGTSLPDISKITEYEEMELSQTAEHTRCYIKVQEGCNQFCSYCAIPLARGRVRSRNPENVVEEVTRIAEAGYHEVVITGIHLSSYGLDKIGKSYNQVYAAGDPDLNAEAQNKITEEETLQNGNLLLSMLEKVHEIEGITRIRLGSLEPRIITPVFAKRLAAMPKICPHFHLSLQSGCDSVLKRMNRRYTCDEFMQSVEILREFYDNPAITTDVITGFPGETEEEFAITKEFLEKVQFFEMHVFPYSKREGTVAATMKGQLSEKEKKERSAVLLAMDQKHSLAYRKCHIGQTMSVLFEQEVVLAAEKYFVGHTKNYLKVAVLSQEDLTGKEVDVDVESMLREDVLFGILHNFNA